MRSVEVDHMRALLRRLDQLRKLDARSVWVGREHDAIFWALQLAADAYPEQWSILIDRLDEESKNNAG